MRKIVIQGTLTILLFIGIWFALTQINWIKVFKVQNITDKTEQKLGELILEVLKKTEKENKNTYVAKSIDSILTRICKANNIDKKTLKIHVFDKDNINAFALPNGHLIIYSGLVLNSDNQGELAGVICHEIAHIKLNHVIKKLIKEIGLSVLISITTGSGATEVIKKIAKILSSSAFDRSLEKEADLKAVDYMIEAKIDPESFANFLYKLSSKEHEAVKYLSWINTHPDSKKRAAYIIDYSKDKATSYKPILSIQTWNRLKEELKN
ncbi:MAG: M48 family metallopeptidase [Tenacibaculum sp.]